MKVVIIGGGASGLAAAVTATRGGADVTILEHKDRVGKKILMTGNGKCNLTNLADYHGNYYGEDVERIYDVLARFTPQDTIAFFKEIGLYTKEKQGGYIYPVSEQAATVLDTLLTACRHFGVQILTECEPLRIVPRRQGGMVICQHAGAQKEIAYDRLILAAGGQAAAGSGSDGSGYQLARKLGHHIILPLPALTALRCEGNYFRAIAGVRAQAKLSLYIEGNHVADEEGELQLTDYGISGIPTFQISRHVSRALSQKKSCSVHIDFLPYLTKEDRTALLENNRQLAYKTAEEFFEGIVHKKIAALLCRRHQIAGGTLIKELSKEKVAECFSELTDWKVTVKATNPFENAQVCSGGVPLAEVTGEMESCLVPQVYLVGELLDCDGICGGYNLQWAWATGVLAGRAVTERK